MRSVGGQGELHGVTRLPNMQKTWGFFNPKFLGEGNHLAVFPEASDLHEVQEQPVRL